MLDRVTKKRIDDLRNILVGKTPSPQSQVEQITTGLIYKFMYDMDAEAVEMGGVPSFFVGDYEKYSWKHLFNPKLGGADKVQLYSDAIENMYTNTTAPTLFREIFKNSYLPFKDSNILNMFLKEINEFHYSDSEILGDAYEYLVSFLGSQGEAGQFRTPRHIIDFIVDIVNPRKNETILDPACGTGGFLISSYKYILNQNTDTRLGDQLNAAERRIISDNIVGYDIDPTFIKISLVNLHLHKFTNPQINEYDTLSSEDRWNEYFDVILANPPFFSPTGGIQPHSRFGVQSTRAEVLFVDYIMEHLKPSGRAGIVVPEGIIFQTGTAYTTLRKKLVEDCLVGVISLPAGVFQPYSGVKTSILILDKELNQKRSNIFFAKVENDGFSLGKQRTAIAKNDLPEITNRIHESFTSSYEGLTSENNFYLKTKEEVLEKDGTPLNFIREATSQINSDFDMEKLEDLVDIRGGGTPSRKKTEYWESGTIKWITCKHLGDEGKVISHEKISELGLTESSANMIPKNSTIVVTRVSVGKINWADEDYAINQDLTGLTVKDERELNPKYLFYMMKSLGEHIKESAQGIGVTGVTRDFIKKLGIPLPPIEVQQEIVNELDGYQKIIDGCRQVIDHYKPTIDIDPSWNQIALGDICTIVRGSSPRPKSDPKYYGGSVPRLMVADLTRDGIFVTPQIDSLTELGATKSRPMKQGEVVIAVSGNPGLPCILNINCCIHDGFVGCRDLDSTVNPEYLCYLLLALKSQTSSQSVGAVFKNLTTDQLKALPLPIPSIDEQLGIVEKLRQEHQIIGGNEQLIDIYTQKIQDSISKVWGE